MQNGVMNGRTSTTPEGALAGYHLKQHKADREQIAPRVQLLTPYLLGRHVESSAHLRARPGQSEAPFSRCRGVSRELTLNVWLLVGFHHLRQTKVQNLYFAADRNKDVLGLDVAMNNVLLMCRLQSTRDLDRQVHGSSQP